MFSVTDAPRRQAAPRGLEMQLVLGRAVEGLALMAAAPEIVSDEHRDTIRRVIGMFRSGVEDLRDGGRTLLQTASSLGVVGASRRALGRNVGDHLGDLATRLEVVVKDGAPAEELLALVDTLIEIHDAITSGGLPPDAVGLPFAD